MVFISNRDHPTHLDLHGITLMRTSHQRKSTSPHNPAPSYKSHLLPLAHNLLTIFFDSFTSIRTFTVSRPVTGLPTTQSRHKLIAQALQTLMESIKVARRPIRPIPPWNCILARERDVQYIRGIVARSSICSGFHVGAVACCRQGYGYFANRGSGAIV